MEPRTAVDGETAAGARLPIDNMESARCRPFPGWPHYSEREIAAVVAVLRSGRVNFWTGEEGRLFEQEFTAYCQRKYAVAVANGSVALELALFALGVGPGDEVIVPCRTFIASASCASVRGATPVFADVDRVSQNITLDTIKRAVTPRTKAIIAVHLAGWPCDMDPILEFARQRGIAIVEDCAQAHGATYKGRRVGSMGDIGAFSFCQDKIITTGGEGGMVVTDNPDYWERMWSYKDHGRNFRLSRMPPDGGFRMIHTDIGTNFRMTEAQSAIGRIQLENIEAQLVNRRRNARLLTTGFSSVPALRVTAPGPEIGHAYYKYYAFVEPERLRPGWDRDRILRTILATGIPCGTGSCSEVYLESAFAGCERLPERLPQARRLGETSLMFLVHPTLTEEHMLETWLSVAKVMEAAVDTKREVAAA